MPLEASVGDLPQAISNSPRAMQAVELLIRQHGPQRQKVNGRPYSEHPLGVGSDIANGGFDEDTITAALLHDIVEDSELTVEDVGERFGDRVAQLVEAMTDTAEVEDYERRKAIHRQRVAAAGPAAVAIFAADKLNTVRALRSAYRSEGEVAGERFQQPLEAKLRVWTADAEMASQYPAALPYAEKLKAELSRLDGDRITARRRPGG